jgi:hypothetical protein
MSEEEWLGCASSYPMLQYLHQHRRIGRVPGGQRLLRLFRCACCRAAWHLFDDERCRRAVEVAERHADGMAPRADLIAARDAAGEADQAALQRWQLDPAPNNSPVWREGFLRMSITAAARWTAEPQFGMRIPHIVTMSIQNAMSASLESVPASPEAAAARRDQDRLQADLVRCLFGNPFRRSPSVPSRCTSRGWPRPSTPPSRP